jgi:hypothetical protein
MFVSLGKCSLWNKERDFLAFRLFSRAAWRIPLYSTISLSSPAPQEAII